MFPRKKTIFAWGILVFAMITLVVQIGKEFHSTASYSLSDGFHVICTHATVRCPFCLTIERLAKETLVEHFNSHAITFHTMDYQQPQFDDLAERFKIATATVLLVHVENSRIIGGKTLTNEIWKSFADSDAMRAMFREQIDAFLHGKIMEPVDATKSFVFESTEEPQSPAALTDEEESLSTLSDADLDRRLGVADHEMTQTPDEYVWIVYFHRLPPCDSCREMSQHILELLTNRFHDEVKQRKILFRYRNFEEEANAVLVQKLKITTPSMAVMLVKNGKPVKAKLAGQIWSLASEKQRLFDYLGELIQTYLSESKGQF